MASPGQTQCAQLDPAKHATRRLRHITHNPINRRRCAHRSSRPKSEASGIRPSDGITQLCQIEFAADAHPSNGAKTVGAKTSIEWGVQVWTARPRTRVQIPVATPKRVARLPTYPHLCFTEEVDQVKVSNIPKSKNHLISHTKNKIDPPATIPVEGARL